ncbi:MAG: sigma 54-interacting transcriptional regulator [Phycisphaerae bacterium]
MTTNEIELQALNTIARILATRAGQREMLLEILDVLDQELGMVRGTIMLLSPDGSELTIEATRSHAVGEQSEMRYRMGEGIMGEVVRTGEAAVVPKVSQEPRFQDRIHRRRPGAGERELSFICVPITLGQEVVGTLSVDTPYDADVDLGEARRVLNIVSSMIANDVKSRRMARLEREALQAENLRLQSALEERFHPDHIVGNSKPMQEVYMKIRQVSASDSTVLVRGESGTGKELVASAIHYSSPRARKPFVKVNCAALNENLLESELFGHEKGSFTGATYARTGRIEEADGGTLFLDEIGDFTPAIQVKMLRVLQEREFQRVGSNRTVKVNIRVIAATNRDLEALQRDGQFRQDLYYRINVFPVWMPPLRDRKDDILLLANHFCETCSERMGKQIRRISTTAINLMLMYHWPGNVRELENCIEHGALLSNDGVIHAHNLPPTLQAPDLRDGGSNVGSLKTQTQVLERDMIVDALKRTGGNMSAAARQLDITPRMVRYKLKKLNIDYQKFFRKPRG